MLLLLFLLSPVFGFSGLDSCEDLQGDTRVVIYFGSVYSCEQESWNAVTSVVFSEAPSGWTGSYSLCISNRREFFWGRKPLHAPWSQWMQHRQLINDTLTLYPSCVSGDSIQCNDDYYTDECDTTPGLATGIVLLSIGGIVMILFLYVLLRNTNRDVQTATKAVRLQTRMYSEAALSASLS